MNKKELIAENKLLQAKILELQEKIAYLSDANNILTSNNAMLRYDVQSQREVLQILTGCEDDEDFCVFPGGERCLN